VVEAATQKLDPSKSPKTLDAKVTDGPNKGAVILGIYEISGDTLKVCFDPEGKKAANGVQGRIRCADARRPQAREEVNQSGKQKRAGVKLSRQWAEPGPAADGGGR
jgi:hypothetical protein